MLLLHVISANQSIRFFYWQQLHLVAVEKGCSQDMLSLGFVRVIEIMYIRSTMADGSMAGSSEESECSIDLNLSCSSSSFQREDERILGPYKFNSLGPIMFFYVIIAYIASQCNQRY